MDRWKQMFYSLTETHRSVMEFGNLKMTWGSIARNTPKGDGHPVLVLPGFGANDWITGTLRDCLKKKNYKAYTWNGGHNLGLDDRQAVHLKKRLEQIFKENGNRKVTIVGHSLGGIYARELAREFPEMVRAVVTLGTPFGGIGDTGATPKMLQAVYRILNPSTAHLLDHAEMAERSLTPPPSVPTTSIFSKQDGVVDWRASLNPASPEAENIEVSSSHVSMVWNALTMTALLDRLAQPEGQWKPFDRSAYSAGLYPAAPDNENIPGNPNWEEKKGGMPPLFKNKR